MLNLTGFHQITADGRLERTFSIDGDVVAWGVSQPRGGPQIAGDVYATILGSGRLYELSVNESLHSILPKVSKGHVVWGQYGEESGIMVWNASRDESWRLETGLQGSLKAVGFDYPWAVYYEQSRYETWAQNLETGERVLVYDSSMLEEREYYNLYRGADVGNGVVVYAVSYANEASDHYNGTFYTFDLETGERQSIEWIGHGINNFRTNGEQTIIESGLKVFVLNHSSKTINKISDGIKSKNCGDVSIGREWGTYSCSWESFAYNIMGSQELHFQATDTYEESGYQVPEYIVLAAHTDGKKLLIHAQTRDPAKFDHQWQNLYWLDLPGGS